jgi:hypothetical protein
MTLNVDEFIRRFLTHVLPKGFHRIRHYGLFSGNNCAETISAVRGFLNLDPPAAVETNKTDSPTPARTTLPMLWRPHVHHRDFRPWPPAASSADHTDRRNQDRHLMIANTASRIIARIWRRSCTASAAACLDTCPVPPATCRPSNAIRRRFEIGDTVCIAR